MTIEKLQRVLWRVRKNNPNEQKPSYLQLRRAIMFECGTSGRTYASNKKALKDLGWIKSFNKSRFQLTDDDLIS